MAIEQQKSQRRIETILERYRSIKINDAKKEDRAYWVLETFDYDRAELIEDELVEHQGPMLNLLSGVLPGKTKKARLLAVDLLDRLMTIPLEGLRATIRKNSELDLGEAGEP